MYLALVMDLWSRKIVGWAMADHLRSELVVRALQIAHTQRRPGNPQDNAGMESAIGKIKSEVLGRTVPANHATAQRQLFVGIESGYNQRRRHSSLGDQSPVAFEAEFRKN